MSWAWTMAGGWLLPGVLGGGLLLLVVRVLARYADGPARRQRLGDWGVAAALLTVALSFGPRWLTVSLPRPDPPRAAEVVAAAPVEPDPVVPPPEVPGEADGALALAPVPDVEPPPAEAALPPASESPPPPAPVPWTDRLAAALGWLGLLHAVGAAILLGRWLLGHVGLWRLLRGAEPAPPEVVAVCRGLCGGRRLPRLLQSRRVLVPLSCGLLRPTVVLPAALCRAPHAAPLRWVLAHELTHLRRHDVLSCLLFGLGEVIFYALPWFWWLRRQARLCREYLADDAAAAQGGAPEDYAQFLLSLTAAPAAPAGAMGVTGHTSDLYRRVAMLLHSPGLREKRPPRLWSLGVAAGLLSLAVLAAGAGLRAAAAPADEPAKKEDVKKEQPQKEEPAKKGDKKEQPKPPDVERLEKFLDDLPADFDPALARQLREHMKQMMEHLPRQPVPGAFPFGPVNPFGGHEAGFRADGFNPFAAPHDGRLGALIQVPPPALVDQLDLPKGQGVVIEDVTPDSPAAKAGMKPHDILLELNGKAVSSNVAEVVKAINALKADTPVDAVVMRKGKKETIKGIKLPEPKKAERPALPGGGIGIGGAGGAGGLPGLPGVGGVVGRAGAAGFAGNAGGGVMTTVFRSGDHFTARHQEGNLVITVSGTVADGKATTKDIRVQDGAAKAEKYESADKVPEQYRDKVKNLIEMGEKGAARVEIK